MTREDQLEAALERLPDLEEAFEKACEAFATAESNYRIFKADEYLKAEGTEKARESTAVKKAANLLRERDKTQAVKEFTFQKLKDCQLVISARQSLLRVDVNTSSAFGR